MAKNPQIYFIPKMDWTKRIVFFLAVLGALWLFIETSAFFNIGSESFRNLGIAGYLSLIVISLAVVLLVEYYKKRKYLGSLEFIKITILIATDGSRHLVEVPKDLNIGIFIEQFIKYLEKGLIGAKIKEALNYYDPHLEVQNGEDFERVSSEITFREAGISDGATCRLKGVVKKNTVVLSPSY
jgi:hypothetical protein